MNASNEPIKTQQNQVWLGLYQIVSARPVVALTLLSLILFACGIASLPPLDRDESRYAQATTQMLETGDYIDIRFQETPRYKKPVGVYWLQALSVSALSTPEARDIWAYRVPSLLAGMLAVLLTYWGGLRLFDRTTGLVAGTLLASSLILIVEANIAKTDAALLAAIVAMQVCLGRLYVDAKPGAPSDSFAVPGPLALLFWVALGISLLVKGPVGLMVAALTIATLCLWGGEWAWVRRLSPLPGMVILIAIILPWASAIWQLTDGAFFADAFLGDMGKKVVSGQESHGAPPGYFTLLSTVTFWPGSLFLIPGLIWAWTNRHDRAVRFLIAWTGPAWIVFELIPTKLPHYTLPLYPALALICSGGVLAWTKHSALAPKAALFGGFLWTLAALGLGFVMLPLPYLPAPSWDLAILVVVFLGLCMTTLWQLLRYQRPLRALGFGVTAMLVFTLTAKLLTIPSLDALLVSPRLVTALETHQVADKPVVIAGYAEPSFVFLTDTSTQLTTGRGAARLLKSTPQAVAIIEGRQLDAFQDEIAKIDVSTQRLETVTGLNYSRGEDVDLTLFRVAP